MSKVETKEIAVFIASPGDLAGERKVFKETIDSLNGGFADGAGLRFVPLGWEDIFSETGRRSQAVINQDVDRCDLFILTLHRRWGQSAPDSKFSSYTEEEFERAFGRWKKTKSPEVLVFFKNVDAASVADPGRELKKVMAFRKKLEKGKHAMYRTFNTETEFGQEIDRHLRAFARGEWKKLDQDTREIDLPKAQVSALSKANREGTRQVNRAERRVSSSSRGGKGKSKQALVAKADLSMVNAYKEELILARAAVEAADDGRIQDATVLFSKATEGTTNPSILALAAEFFRQMGDVDNASRLVRRQAAVTRDRTVAAQHYLALYPPGWSAALQQQIEARLLASADPEFADALRCINEEIWGGGRLDKIILDMAVKHFSAEERTQFARFLGTAEGQSSLQKQQLLIADILNFIEGEIERVMKKRGYDLEQPEGLTRRSLNAAPAILPEPKRLSTGDNDSESAVATPSRRVGTASKRGRHRSGRSN